MVTHSLSHPRYRIQRLATFRLLSLVLPSFRLIPLLLSAFVRPSLPLHAFLHPRCTLPYTGAHATPLPRRQKTRLPILPQRRDAPGSRTRRVGQSRPPTVSGAVQSRKSRAGVLGLGVAVGGRNGGEGAVMGAERGGVGAARSRGCGGGGDGGVTGGEGGGRSASDCCGWGWRTGS